MLTTEILKRRGAKLVLATVAALLIALTLGTASLTGRAGAAPPPGGGCDPDVNPACGNRSPTITLSHTSATVEEGQQATNSGTYRDNDIDDVVTITASRGQVTKTGTGSGSWSWSETPDDGPSQGGTVSITADDGFASRSTTFTLTVVNAAPTATLNSPDVDEGNQYCMSLENAQDPSSADRNAGFAYAHDLGWGYGSFVGENNVCSVSRFGDDGAYNIGVKIRDKDGGISEYRDELRIRNLPPSATFNAPTSAVDPGSNFTISLTGVQDPNFVSDSVSLSFSCDGGATWSAWTSPEFSESPISKDHSCTAGNSAQQKVRGKVRDDDGGENSYEKTVTVNVPSPPSTTTPVVTTPTTPTTPTGPGIDPRPDKGNDDKGHNGKGKKKCKDKKGKDKKKCLKKNG